jgi:hypothetical protein
MVSLCRTSCCLLGKGPSELRGFYQAICIVQATHKKPRIFCTVYGMVPKQDTVHCNLMTGQNNGELVISKI